VRAAVAVGALAVLLGVEAQTLHLGAPWLGGGRRLLIAYAIGWAVFAVAVIALPRLPARQTTALILGGAAALQVVAVCFAPTTTDDFYRYVWDGTVQAHGIDPYRYTPLDPALKPLRDPWLFPTGPVATGLVEASPAKGWIDACTYAGVPHDCTRINRPTVHTIYPPVAEAAFTGLHWISPHGLRRQSVQVFAAALAWLTAAALIVALRRWGRDLRAAAWWAWCPTVWLECGNNAHIDVLGILLLVGTFGLLNGSAARYAIAGALFGAAVAVKLVPALVAPALAGKRERLRRARNERGAQASNGRNWVFFGSAAAVFLMGYLPHLLAVGTDVIGYLPGYLHEEGYSGQERFGVLGLEFPRAWTPVVATLLLGVAALVVFRDAARRPPARGALLLAGIAFVLVGPSQPWYGLLIVALVVLADRPEWLAVAAAAYPVYLAGTVRVDSSLMQQRTYLPAACFVLFMALARIPVVRRAVRLR
jgi:hypothetical protein